MPKDVNTGGVPVPRRGRGRPRSAEAQRAILRAARELLHERGLPGLTMEGIAVRARVGKPTIYRWWPDRHAVAMAALMEESGESARTTRRAPLDALRQQLEQVVAVFASPTGRAAAGMIAAADANSELAKAFRSHFILARREEGRALLEQAVKRTEIRRDANVEVVLDMLYGAVFFRLLMGHARLDSALVGQVLDETLRGLRSERTPRRRGRA